MSLAFAMGIALAHAAIWAPRSAAAGAAAPRARFTRSEAFATYPPGSLPVAWGDCDDDGDQDLPLNRNEGDGVFAEMPGFRTLLRDGNYHGAAWADWDEDGDLDLVILPYPEFQATRARMLRNLGGCRFVDVGETLGMDVDGFGETPAWGDFDGDGWLDLFAPFYSHLAPFRSFLYRSNGDGTFTDVAEAAGAALPGLAWWLRPEGAQAADWDGDGDLDLYCASHLLVNDGSGRFTDVRAAVGLAERFDEGAMFVDFDNDGRLDLYIRGLDSGHLARNEGDRFTDVTKAARLPSGPAAWGDSFADADHDGDLDLLYFKPGTGAELLLNQGDGTFVADPDFAALDVRGDSSAWADVDGDGDLDVGVGTFDKVLLRNGRDAEPGFAHSYLRVEVLDAEGRRTQHGATVRIRRLDAPGTSVQTRVVDGGSGYLSQGEYAVHFGVEPAGRYGLEVSFPSGSGSRHVVGAARNPALGTIEPQRLTSQTLAVFRDGRVVADGREIPPAPCAAHDVFPRDLRCEGCNGTPVPARVARLFARAVRLERHGHHRRAGATLDRATARLQRAYTHHRLSEQCFEQLEAALALARTGSGRVRDGA